MQSVFDVGYGRMSTTEPRTGSIVLYKADDGSVALDVQMHEETVWLNLNQIASLFGVDKSGVSRHIRNVFQAKELPRRGTVAKIATVQKEGGRQISRQIDYFNLDLILSVGYRVNSRRAAQFRIWATTTLRQHLTEGFTLNRRLLKERGMDDLSRVVALVKSAMETHALSGSEAEGLLRVITGYADTWLLLQQYDEERLSEPKNVHRQRFAFTHTEAVTSIAALKKNLLRRKQASDLFGRERHSGLKGIIGALEQTFDGKELYASVEEKAAHLLYFVIKDHPFVDGNKRIAAFLFIVYLLKNQVLTGRTGERKFNDNALVALCLLVAQSDPKEKNVMMALIMNFVSTGS